MESGAVDSGYVHNPRFRAALIRKIQGMLAKSQFRRLREIPAFASVVQTSRFLARSRRKRARGARIRPQTPVSCKARRLASALRSRSGRFRLLEKRFVAVPDVWGPDLGVKMSEVAAKRFLDGGKRPKGLRGCRFGRDGVSEAATKLRARDFRASARKGA